MRYFIQLSYDGTDYHGWQVQPNGISVQQELQDCLSTLLHTRTNITGAGRTDSGVHASKMIAHFEADNLTDTQQLVYKLNKMTSPAISVHKIWQVSEDMHARFSAKSRTYHYFVHIGKDAYLNRFSHKLYLPTDFERMNEAAKVLFEYKDFTSFSKTGTDTATNDCTIMNARWVRIETESNALPNGGTTERWRFEITANRFLRNMVRAIVGTLLKVGEGKMTVEDMRRVIEKKDRCSAGDSVPGKALFLVNIEY